MCSQYSGISKDTLDVQKSRFSPIPCSREQIKRWQWWMKRNFLYYCSSDPSMLRYIWTGSEGHSVACSEGFRHKASVLVPTKRCQLSCTWLLFILSSWLASLETQRFFGTLNIIGILIHLTYLLIAPHSGYKPWLFMQVLIFDSARTKDYREYLCRQYILRQEREK